MSRGGPRPQLGHLHFLSPALFIALYIIKFIFLRTFVRTHKFSWLPSPHPHLLALLEREYLFSKKFHLFLLVRVLTSWSSCVSLLFSWFSTPRLPAFIAQLGKVSGFLENGLVSLFLLFFFLCNDCFWVVGYWAIRIIYGNPAAATYLHKYTEFLFGWISRCKFCFSCGGENIGYIGSITSIRCWFPCNFSWMRNSELQFPTFACNIGVMQLFCWIEANNFSVCYFLDLLLWILFPSMLESWGVFQSE